MSLSYADRKQLVLSVTDAEREASAARRLPVLELLALSGPRPLPEVAGEYLRQAVLRRRRSRGAWFRE